MEYMELGDLSTLLGQNPNGLSANIAMKVARDIVQGLQYLHENKIIHRDLKPGGTSSEKCIP